MIILAMILFMKMMAVTTWMTMIVEMLIITITLVRTTLLSMSIMTMMRDMNMKTAELKACFDNTSLHGHQQ